MQPYSSEHFQNSSETPGGCESQSRVQCIQPTGCKSRIVAKYVWPTAAYLRPTIYRGNYFEYNDDCQFISCRQGMAMDRSAQYSTDE